MLVGACGTSGPGPMVEDAAVDLDLRAREGANERWLIAAYDDALRNTRAANSAAAGSSDLDPDMLALLRDQHQAHLDAILAFGPAMPTGPETARPGAQTAGDQALLRAERDAFAQRSAAALAAIDGALARLFTLIAASEASHVPYLMGRSAAGAARRTANDGAGS